MEISAADRRPGSHYPKTTASRSRILRPFAPAVPCGPARNAACCWMLYRRIDKGFSSCRRGLPACGKGKSSCTTLVYCKPFNVLFPGLLFGSGEKRCKVRNYFRFRKIFRDIFFAFAVLATSERVWRHLSPRPRRRPCGGGNLRSPKASAKLGIPPESSKFSSRKFCENML